MSMALMCHTEVGHHLQEAAHGYYQTGGQISQFLEDMATGAKQYCMQSLQQS